MPALTAAQPQTALTWEELCTNPQYAFLDDLPFKIETNEWGQLVMSPTYQRHGFYQVEIAARLRELLPEGTVVTESAVRTRKGAKVADVAWYSAPRWAEVKDTFDAPIAPEICVEVRSASNTSGEMEEKCALYLDTGAEEVWVCDLQGEVQFFTREGEVKRSARVSDFPQKIEA